MFVAYLLLASGALDSLELISRLRQSMLIHATAACRQGVDRRALKDLDQLFHKGMAAKF